MAAEPQLYKGFRADIGVEVDRKFISQGEKYTWYWRAAILPPSVDDKLPMRFGFGCLEVPVDKDNPIVYFHPNKLVVGDDETLQDVIETMLACQVANSALLSGFDIPFLVNQVRARIQPQIVEERARHIVGAIQSVMKSTQVPSP